MKRAYTPTITQTETQVKKAIYLVLKQKPLPEQMLDDIREEAERRFEAFMNENLHILNNVRPDDPENFMKCFMLRGLIMILDKMFEERHIKLTQKDKDTIQKIFDNDGEIQNGKEKEKDKEKKQIPPVPGKNMHENKYPYYPYP